MKKLLFLFFILYYLPVFSCIPILYFYQKIDGKIYFGSSSFPEGFIEVEGADTLSFTMLKNYQFYGKDKNAVYYKGIKIEGANPVSFEMIGGSSDTFGHVDGYTKDDKYIFIANKKIDSADVNTFNLLHSKYDENVFKFIQPQLFRGLSAFDNGYARDKKYVFLWGEVLEYDAATFELIGWGYSKDRRGIYYNGKLIIQGNPSNYWHSLSYLVDNDSVYYAGEIMPFYDGTSFELVDVYAREQTSCGGIRIVASLTRDKNGIYLNNKRLDEIDPYSFTKHNKYSISDKKGLYEMNVRGSNPVSFQKIISFNTENAKRENLNFGRKQYIFINSNDSVYLLTVNKDIPDFDFRHWNDKILHNLTLSNKIDAASFETYLIMDDFAIFRDKNYYYKIDAFSDKLQTIMPSSFTIELLYFDKEVAVLRKGENLFYINSNKIANDITGHPATYYYVQANNILRKKGYDSGLFMDKFYLYKDNSKMEPQLTQKEYTQLQKYIIRPSKWEELRIESLKNR